MPNIFIDVWTRLHKNSMDDVDRDVQSNFKKMAQKAANNFATEFESANPRIRKAAAGIMDANSRLAASNKLVEESRRRVNEQSRTVEALDKRITDARNAGAKAGRDMAQSEALLADARRDLSRASRDFIRDTDAFERAARRQQLALKSLEDTRRGSQGGGGGRRGGGQASNTLGGIFTSIPFVPGGKAGAVIGSGMVAVLGSVAEAATTASQSLWLLPAAAAAGGAAFVTLKLGLEGFDKALKDMGDAKKFAEDLQGLAPSAQQAALEIQKLMTGMDGLKQVTQSALFKGVAQELSMLGQTFMPQIKQLTTGVADAFNGMFHEFGAQLRTPGTSAAIGTMINNIVQAFHNLEPAIGPVVDAFTKIAKVGTDFLPGMATSIANLATKFADFITNAERSGQLHHWIQQGIDAAVTLGDIIGDLAHKIYDVFGGKDPEQFKHTLEGMVDTAIAVAGAIVGISHVVNGLVQDLQPVADAVGGWPNLISDVISAWAEWKVVSTISDLLKISDLLAVTLPASAETGAAGISAALSRVAVPVWLTTLMALWNAGGDSGPGPNIPGGSPMGPGSKEAQDFKAKQDAGQGYAKEHGGQMPQGYMDWLKGGKMPQGMDKYYVPPAAPGTPFFDDKGRPLDANGKPFGGGPANPTPFNPNDPKSYAPGKDPKKPWEQTPWTDIPVPEPPDKKKGHKDKLPKVVSPLDPSFGAPPRPGETEQEYSAEGTLMQAKHRKADDEATLQALEKDNNATAEQIQNQKNKIIEDQRAINKAELELQNAQDNAAKKQLKSYKELLSGMKDIGPQLDEDFGLSKGLPGLAKNLVEFLGSLAAAPLLGPLAAMRDADPLKGGFGAIGIMGEANIRAGKSPLLGIPAGQPGGLSVGNAMAAIPGTVAGGGVGKSLDGTAGDMDPRGAFEGKGRGSGQGSVVLPNGGGQKGVAQAIYSSIRQAGYSHNTALTAVSDSMFESSLDPDVTNASGHHGLFQESADKPSNGIGQQIGWFLSQLEGVGGPGVVDQDPANIIADKIERGGYPGSNYNQFMGQASSLIGPTGGGLLGMALGQGAGVQSAGFGQGGGGVGALQALVGPGGPGTSPNGFPLNAPEQAFSINGVGTQLAQGAPGQRLAAFAQWFNDNIEPVKELAGYDAGGHGLGNQSNHTSGTALDVNWSDFTALQGHGADARTHFGPDKMAAISQMLSQFGMTWGQYWTPDSRDPGHFELGGAPYSKNGPQNVGWHDGTGGQGGGVGPIPTFPGPRPSPGPGGGNPGFPMPGGQGFPGPGGGTPGFPMPGSGPGSGLTDTSSPSPVGGQTGGGWQPEGGGGLGLGGMPASAIVSAAGMFPGGGAAAQLAIQLMNRTIQYGGELAAIGVQGLGETFGVHDPDGGGGGLSDMGNNIFGRVLKGMSHAKPATPTAAGKTALPQNQQQQQQQDPGQGQQQGPNGSQFNGGLHVHGDFVQAPNQNPQNTFGDLAYMGALGASTPIMA